MIFVCKLPISKINGYLFSLLSLSGASPGSPNRVRQIMILIKTVSKTTCPLFYIYQSQNLPQITDGRACVTYCTIGERSNTMDGPVMVSYSAAQSENERKSL